MSEIQKEMTLSDLWDKPKDQQFNEEEIAFLKEQFPKKKFLAKYGIWKQKRHNGLYITFIIDNFPGRVRPCAADHSIEVICTRELTDQEWLEEIGNFGCNSRVMTAWDYQFIEELIAEDEKFGISTPEKFIKECRRRGYGSINENIDNAADKTVS